PRNDGRTEAQVMKRYQLQDSKKIYSGIIFDVQLDTVTIPTGKTVTRDIVIHGRAVVIVPQTNDEQLLLVKQYRHAVGESILEFPAGTIEKGERELARAKRRSIGEVGHRGGSWTPLGDIYSAPGFTKEKLHLFFAKDPTLESAEGDDDEIIDVVTLS